MNVFTIIKTFLDAMIPIVMSFASLLIPVVIFLIFIILSSFYWFLYNRYVLKIKPIKNEYNNYYFSYNGKKYYMKIPYKKVKKVTLFQNIFISLPKQIGLDLANRDPNHFRDFGIHIVCGEQGSGKTITVVYLLEQWKSMYPKMKIYTNMSYKYENGPLNHWTDLINRNNGVYGIANVIDEIKTWWSNKESKDVPSEVLSEICQQRKQRKAIIGTVQIFSELARPFRMQTHYVYVPRTYLGCFTIVFKTKAKYYNAEKDTFRKFCGCFCFAHTKELRDAYDTYKRIEKYKEIEFDTSNAFLSSEALEFARTQSSESKTLKKKSKL